MPDDAPPQASADELCFWLEDKIAEYACLYPDLTVAVCVEALRLVRQGLGDDGPPPRQGR